MADTWTDYYTPATDTTYQAPADSGVGTATDYTTSYQGTQLPESPATSVTTQSSAPAQSFTATDTGYTPTYNYTSYQNAVPNYGASSSQTTTPSYTLYDSSGQAYQATSPAYGATSTSTYGAPANAFAGPGSTTYDVTNVPNVGGIPVPTARPTDLSQTSAQNVPYSDTGAGGDQTKSTSDFLKGLGLSGGDIVKLLLGGAGGLMSYASAQKAQQQASDAAAAYKQAADTAAQQYRDVAQPYITAGGSQLSMALQGSLSPALMQQYQAQQARLAQAAAKSGGVGAIQTAAAEQTMYNNALQQQQTMALQLLGQGDPYLSDAIKAELSGEEGALEYEYKYGTQAATALGNMMSSLGSSLGRTA
jgi:hypothetical protein